MTAHIAVIDYQTGNLANVATAVRRAIAESGQNLALDVTDDARVIAQAERLILPGVGAFGACRQGLEDAGLVDVLKAAVAAGTPFLGICVGMQLMAEAGEERGRHEGLGFLPGVVKGLEHFGTPEHQPERLPHMGWSPLSLTAVGNAHPLLNGLDGAPVYFVHSYAMDASDAHVLGTVRYGGTFPALVGRDNLIGAQFHPERSQDAGIGFLTRFLTWTPEQQP